MFLQEYEKIRQLGKGAFASVYKVRHSKLGYVRALKVCNNFIEDENDRAWQAFVSECKVLLQIGNGSHPNIVRIYQPRLLDNRAVVEMDCVEGEPLSDYIREKRFIPIDEFYRFAHQIIGAVAYCHVDVYRFLMNPVKDGLEIDPTDGRKYIVSPAKERELIGKYGVVHNDLHSGNIIRRDYDGQYILLDFGLAVQDKHCVKSSSRFDGAIEYCSPEKLEGGDISARSDVYALGILLYEMLAGRVPFPYKHTEDSSLESARNRVYMQHMNEMPPSIYELRTEAFGSAHPGHIYDRDYPEALEKLIMRCLAKNPAERPTNAKTLLDEYEAAISKGYEEVSKKHTIGSVAPAENSNEEMAAKISEMQNLQQEIEHMRNHPLPSVNKEVPTPVNIKSERTKENAAPDFSNKSSNRKWILISALLLVATIGTGFWGYCMMLDYESVLLLYHNFQGEATDKGYYVDSLGVWKDDIVPSEQRIFNPIDTINPVDSLSAEAGRVSTGGVFSYRATAIANTSKGPDKDRHPKPSKNRAESGNKKWSYRHLKKNTNNIASSAPSSNLGSVNPPKSSAPEKSSPAIFVPASQNLNSSQNGAPNTTAPSHNYIRSSASNTTDIIGPNRTSITTSSQDTKEYTSDGNVRIKSSASVTTTYKVTVRRLPKRNSYCK